MREVLFTMVAMLVVPDIASAAACCDLRKVDAEPPTTQIRACDPAAVEGCAAWILERSFTAGETAPVCVSGEIVRYQEWDPALDAWGPDTDARCDAGGEVEL
jgi:hypothetical protein